MSRSKIIRLIIIFLAAIGAGIMVYLTYISFTQNQSFCDISKEVSCDIVVNSLYSKVFGIPVSVLGLFYFLAVLISAVFNKKENVFKTIFVLTLLGIIPSLYLTFTEIFFIKSLCVLCETSKVLMLGILVVSLTGMKFAGEKDILRLSAPIIIAGLAAAGIMYFSQTGIVVKKDYSEFAQCLNEKGVVYYKSVRCSTCRRQEALLGPAYSKLNSVECHPEGENPRVELCLDKKISKTPTFLIEQNGLEIKRAEGLQQIKDLASFAGCAVPE